MTFISNRGRVDVNKQNLTNYVYKSDIYVTCCNERSLITISGNTVWFLHDPARLLLAIPTLLPRLLLTIRATVLLLMLLGLLLVLLDVGTLLVAAGGFVVQLRHGSVKHGVKGKYHAAVFGASIRVD